jgi:tRNA(Arg) A34 adenosine deaminase TadA
MRYSRFRKAREEMLRADYSGPARIGCAVYYKGTLLVRGHNSNKTSPLQKRYNTYRYKNCDTPDKTHAEMAALKKIRWLDIDFSQVEVYTYRELKNGSLSLSRPCESCLAFMKQLGIKRICYTTPDGYAEERLIY